VPQPSAEHEVEKTIKLYWSMQLRDARLEGGDDAFSDRDYSGGGVSSWRQRSITFTTESASGGGLDRRYRWRDTRRLTVSAGGMSNVTKSHTDYAGTWSIDVVGGKPYLVMQDGDRGRLRYSLAEARGGGILLDGRPYTRRRV
jgi:hypothetical protein